MHIPRFSTVATYAAWIGAGAVAVCFATAIVENPRPGQFTLPFLFWSMYTGFVVFALACAIGLPAERAGFWRTLCVVLFVCGGYYSEWGELLLHRLVFDKLSPPSLQRWLTDFDGWSGELVAALAHVFIALGAASAAIYFRRDVPATNFRFRLWHLFLLSTFVACSLGAIRNAAFMLNYVHLFLAATRIFAAVLAGARRGHPAMVWGYLAGSYGCQLMADRGRLQQEWGELLPPGEGSPYPLIMLVALLPIYAGLATGMLAGMMFRPAVAEPATELLPLPAKPPPT